MNYMLDSFHETGFSLESLNQTLETLDQNTSYEILDFSLSWIMSRLGRHKGKIAFATIIPGDELYDRTEDGFIWRNPEIKYYDADTLPKDLDREMTSDPEGCGTAFCFENPDNLSKFYFTSRFLSKTLPLRTPVSDGRSSFERDLLMSRQLVYGDNTAKEDGSVVKAVVRKCDGFSKIFAVFSAKQNLDKVSYSGILDLALHLGSGKLLYWEISQRYCTFLYAYDDEILSMENNPDELIPCHAFTVSDTCYKATSIASAWYNAKENTYFITDTFNFNSIKEFYAKELFLKSIHSHLESVKCKTKDASKKFRFVSQGDVREEARKILEAADPNFKLTGNGDLRKVLADVSEGFDENKEYTVFGLKRAIASSLVKSAENRPYKIGVLRDSLLGQVYKA